METFLAVRRSPLTLYSDPSRLPVRTIIFLAAPHRGLNVAAMQTLVKGKAPERLVNELSESSAVLREINTRFGRIARDTDILSCFETKPTKTAIAVSRIDSRIR